MLLEDMCRHSVCIMRMYVPLAWSTPTHGRPIGSLSESAPMREEHVWQLDRFVNFAALLALPRLSHSFFADLSTLGVNLYTFGVALGPPPPPIISYFNIRPMSLHGKNVFRSHKFNIWAPQSFSEIDIVAFNLLSSSRSRDSSKKIRLGGWAVKFTSHVMNVVALQARNFSLRKHINIKPSSFLDNALLLPSAILYLVSFAMYRGAAPQARNWVLKSQPSKPHVFSLYTFILLFRLRSDTREISRCRSDITLREIFFVIQLSDFFFLWNIQK